MDDQQNAVCTTDRVQVLFALDHAIFKNDYVRVAEDSARLRIICCPSTTTV
jgi:hypothetical protein